MLDELVVVRFYMNRRSAAINHRILGNPGDDLNRPPGRASGDVHSGRRLPVSNGTGIHGRSAMSCRTRAHLKGGLLDSMRAIHLTVIVTLLPLSLLVIGQGRVILHSEKQLHENGKGVMS